MSLVVVCFWTMEVFMFRCQFWTGQYIDVTNYTMLYLQLATDAMLTQGKPRILFRSLPSIARSDPDLTIYVVFSAETNAFVRSSNLTLISTRQQALVPRNQKS